MSNRKIQTCRRYGHTRVGDCFYVDRYQGFHGEDYVLAMRDILTENGIDGITIERVE